MMRDSRENPYQERFLTGRFLSCVVLCLLQEGQQRRKLLKDMVGTWGLEPQTSTVSTPIYSIPLTTYTTARDRPNPWKYV
jgi:hypothetical protein